MVLLFMHPRRLHLHHQPHRLMTPAMATVAPAMVAMVVALPALPLVALAMAVAIQVRMVRRMVTLPRRLHLHPHHQPHRPLASNQ